MNILVCIKAVPDPQDAIRFAAGAPVVDVDKTTDLKMNRFDEYAVEEAVLIKKRFSGVVVDIVSMGPENAKKALKRAVGMGADAGIHIESSYRQSCDAACVATCIAQVAKLKSYDLILTGIMSEDRMQSQVGPMIAALLCLPWATSVIHESIREDQKIVYVERELEGGVREMIDIDLPALLAVQSGINEPRYPSLSNLLRASALDMQIFVADTLGGEKKTSRILGYAYPEKTRAGLILEGSPEEKADALIKILREKNLL